MPLVSCLLHILLYAQLAGAATVLILQSLQFVTYRRIYYFGQFSTEQPSVATLLCFLISGFSILVSMVLLCLSRRKTFKVSSMDRGIGLAMTSVWTVLVIVLFLLEHTISGDLGEVGAGYKAFWIAVRVMAIFTLICWAMRTFILYTSLVRLNLESSSSRPSTQLQTDGEKWRSQPSMSESFHSFAINDKHMNPNPSTTSLHSSRRGSQLKYTVANISLDNITPLPRTSSTRDKADISPSTRSGISDSETLPKTDNYDKDKHRSHIFNEIHTDRET